MESLTAVAAGLTGAAVALGGFEQAASKVSRPVMAANLKTLAVVVFKPPPGILGNKVCASVDASSRESWTVQELESSLRDS
jgi:hypothetical protein